MRSFLTLCLLLTIHAGYSHGEACYTGCKEVPETFNYEIGKSYVYKLKTTTVLSSKINSTKALVSGDVILTKVDKCDFALQLSDMKFEGLEEDPNLPAIAEQMTSRVSKFGFDDGLIPRICFEEDEPTWIVNLKRSILSALQLSVPDLGGVRIVEEVDIFGRCETRFEATFANRGITIIKNKKLRTCESNTLSYPIGVKLLATLWDKSPEVNCRMTINSKRLLTSSSCTETYPTLYGESKFGRFGEISLSLESDSNKVIDTSKMELVKPKSTCLAQRKVYRSPKTREEMHKILGEICDQLRKGVSEKTIEYMVKLSGYIKTLEPDVLKQVFKEVFVLTDKADTPDPNLPHYQCNMRKLRSIFIEATLKAKSRAAIELVRNVLGPLVSRQRLDNFVSSLGSYANPCSDYVNSVLPFLEDHLSDQAIFGITNVLQNHLESTHEPKDYDAVRRALHLIAAAIDGSDVSLSVLRIRALGNVRLADKEINERLMLLLSRSPSSQIGFAILDTLRRIDPCNNDVYETAVKLAKDTTRPMAVRVAAFKLTMACPSRMSTGMGYLDDIQPKDDNFLNYVRSYIDNSASSFNRYKANQAIIDWRMDQQNLISNNSVPSAIYKLDKSYSPRMSRNIEFSHRTGNGEMSLNFDVDWIVENDHLMPTWMIMNVSAMSKAKTYNLIEIGMRQEGTINIDKMISLLSNSELANKLLKGELNITSFLAGHRTPEIEEFMAKFSEIYMNQLNMYVNLDGRSALSYPSSDNPPSHKSSSSSSSSKDDGTKKLNLIYITQQILLSSLDKIFYLGSIQTPSVTGTLFCTKMYVGLLAGHIYDVDKMQDSPDTMDVLVNPHFVLRAGFVLKAKPAGMDGPKAVLKSNADVLANIFAHGRYDALNEKDKKNFKLNFNTSDTPTPLVRLRSYYSLRSFDGHKDCPIKLGQLARQGGSDPRTVRRPLCTTGMTKMVGHELCLERVLNHDIHYYETTIVLHKKDPNMQQIGLYLNYSSLEGQNGPDSEINAVFELSGGQSARRVRFNVIRHGHPHRTGPEIYHDAEYGLYFDYMGQNSALKSRVLIGESDAKISLDVNGNGGELYYMISRGDTSTTLNGNLKVNLPSHKTIDYDIALNSKYEPTKPLRHIDGELYANVSPTKKVRLLKVDYSREGNFADISIYEKRGIGLHSSLSVIIGPPQSDPKLSMNMNVNSNGFLSVDANFQRSQSNKQTVFHEAHMEVVGKKTVEGKKLQMSGEYRRSNDPAHLKFELRSEAKANTFAFNFTTNQATTPPSTLNIMHLTKLHSKRDDPIDILYTSTTKAMADGPGLLGMKFNKEFYRKVVILPTKNLLLLELNDLDDPKNPKNYTLKLAGDKRDHESGYSVTYTLEYKRPQDDNESVLKLLGRYTYGGSTSPSHHKVRLDVSKSMQGRTPIGFNLVADHFHSSNKRSGEIKYTDLDHGRVNHISYDFDLVGKSLSSANIIAKDSIKRVSHLKYTSSPRTFKMALNSSYAQMEVHSNSGKGVYTFRMPSKNYDQTGNFSISPELFYLTSRNVGGNHLIPDFSVKYDKARASGHIQFACTAYAMLISSEKGVHSGRTIEASFNSTSLGLYQRAKLTNADESIGFDVDYEHKDKMAFGAAYEYNRLVGSSMKISLGKAILAELRNTLDRNVRTRKVALMLSHNRKSVEFNMLNVVHNDDTKKYHDLTVDAKARCGQRSISLAMACNPTLKRINFVTRGQHGDIIVLLDGKLHDTQPSVLELETPVYKVFTKYEKLDTTKEFQLSVKKADVSAVEYSSKYKELPGNKGEIEHNLQASLDPGLSIVGHKKVEFIRNDMGLEFKSETKSVINLADTAYTFESKDVGSIAKDILHGPHNLIMSQKINGRTEPRVVNGKYLVKDGQLLSSFEIVEGNVKILAAKIDGKVEGNFGDGQVGQTSIKILLLSDSMPLLNGNQYNLDYKKKPNSREVSIIKRRDGKTPFELQYKCQRDNGSLRTLKANLMDKEGVMYTLDMGLERGDSKFKLWSKMYEKSSSPSPIVSEIVVDIPLESLNRIFGNQAVVSVNLAAKGSKLYAGYTSPDARTMNLNVGLDLNNKSIFAYRSSLASQEGKRLNARDLTNSNALIFKGRLDVFENPVYESEVKFQTDNISFDIKSKLATANAYYRSTVPGVAYNINGKICRQSGNGCVHFDHTRDRNLKSRELKFHLSNFEGLSKPTSLMIYEDDTKKLNLLEINGQRYGFECGHAPALREFSFYLPQRTLKAQYHPARGEIIYWNDFDRKPNHKLRAIASVLPNNATKIEIFHPVLQHPVILSTENGDRTKSVRVSYSPNPKDDLKLTWSQQADRDFSKSTIHELSVQREGGELHFGCRVGYESSATIYRSLQCFWLDRNGVKQVTGLYGKLLPRNQGETQFMAGLAKSEMTLRRLLQPNGDISNSINLHAGDNYVYDVAMNYFKEKRCHEMKISKKGPENPEYKVNLCMKGKMTTPNESIVSLDVVQLREVDGTTEPKSDLSLKVTKVPNYPSDYMVHLRYDPDALSILVMQILDGKVELVRRMELLKDEIRRELQHKYKLLSDNLIDKVVVPVVNYHQQVVREISDELKPEYEYFKQSLHKINDKHRSLNRQKRQTDNVIIDYNNFAEIEKLLDIKILTMDFTNGEIKFLVRNFSPEHNRRDVRAIVRHFKSLMANK